MIRQPFDELPVSAFLLFYHTLVRPHLEYATQASSPNLTAGVNQLEAIATDPDPGVFFA